MSRMRPMTAFRSPRSQQGFSLLEIIIVLVLIGGIVVLIGSRVIGGADSGKVKTAQIQLQTLSGSIERYQLETGRYPTQLSDLVTQPAGVAGWLGPYAREKDLQDPWNNPIEYRIPGETQRFDLISLGADGKAGGNSVDSDIRNE